MKHLRQTLAASGALLLVVLASCTPAETKRLLEPSQALGTVLAEETVRTAGPRKQIVLVVPQWGAASTVGESLKAALKKQGFTVSCTLPADVGNPMRSGRTGFKADDFFAALEKTAGAGAVVSLAGPPHLTAGDAARLSPDHAPVLVVATASLGNVMGVPGNPLQLAGLIEAKTIQLAIIDGADPAQPSGKTDTIHQAFAQNYRLLRRPD